MQDRQLIRLLALDFDGVIVDSVLECAVVAYNGYQAYQRLATRINSPQEIPADMLTKFRSMRPYIRSGEDYLSLFQALDADITISGQGEFDKFHDIHLDRKESYYQLFYAEREALMIADNENWIALNPPYDGMIEYMQSLNHELQLHIVSTKASKYISEILDNNGIRLSNEQVHQAGRGSSKADIINFLFHKNHLSPGELAFVDDHPDTVQKVSETGAVCFLAGWGYNTVEQRHLIMGNDIPVIGLNKLKEIGIYGNS